MSPPNQETGVEMPTFENPEALARFAHENGVDGATLDQARNSTAARRNLVNRLRTNFNGASDRIAARMLDSQQEFDRKGSWLRRIPLIGKPLDWMWQQYKKHPIIYTLLIAAIAAGGMAYYWGWLGKYLPVPNYMRPLADANRALVGGPSGSVPLAPPTIQAAPAPPPPSWVPPAPTQINMPPAPLGPATGGEIG